MAKKALITGVTGQDGSYLAELLLEKGYKVYGLNRRTSTPNYSRIKDIVDQIELVSGDLMDQHSLTQAIKDIQPDEIYNLAAQSFVKASWEQPMFTGESTGLGVARMLEAVRFACPTTKFYQASSSEMFGKVQEIPQVESTPFWPRSPYGVAKVYATDHRQLSRVIQSLCRIRLCLTTSRRVEGSSLSPGKSATPYQIKYGKANSYIWAT